MKNSQQDERRKPTLDLRNLEEKNESISRIHGEAIKKNTKSSLGTKHKKLLNEKPNFNEQKLNRKRVTYIYNCIDLKAEKKTNTNVRG